MAVAVSWSGHFHPVYRCIGWIIPKTDGCLRDWAHHAHRHAGMGVYLCLVGSRRLLRSRFRSCCGTPDCRNTTGSSNLEQTSSCSFLHFAPLTVGANYRTRIEVSDVKDLSYLLPNKY